jgi:hypothetical protein
MKRPGDIVIKSYAVSYLGRGEFAIRKLQGAILKWSIHNKTQLLQSDPTVVAEVIQLRQSSTKKS